MLYDARFRIKALENSARMELGPLHTIFVGLVKFDIKPGTSDGELSASLSAAAACAAASSSAAAAPRSADAPT